MSVHFQGKIKTLKKMLRHSFNETIIHLQESWSKWKKERY